MRWLNYVNTICLILMFVGCSTYNGIEGTYTNHYQNRKDPAATVTVLEIRSDSTFELLEYTDTGIFGDNGVWRTSNDTIILDYTEIPDTFYFFNLQRLGDIMGLNEFIIKKNILIPTENNKYIYETYIVKYYTLRKEK